MKKIFNLAVIFAAMMTAFTFTSCSDEDKAEEQVQEQQLEQIAVLQGNTYGFSNAALAKSGFFKVISATGTAGSKVVEIEITTKKDDQKGEIFTLGDDEDHTSYLKWDGTKFENVKQSEAEANADKIIFCLASAENNYVITSATVNNKVKATGKATTTYFSIK